MSDNKQVAKKKSNLPALNFDKYVGDNYDDGVDNDSLILPRIKVVQGTTSDKGSIKLGNFMNTMGVDLGSEIEFFILLTWRSRILFTGDLSIKCKAMDGRVSSQGEFAGQECKNCPKSQWASDKKPECTLIYNYAVALKEELIDAIKNRTMLPPIIIGFHSASTKTAKYINTNIRINTGRKRPIWADLINLHTELKKFSVGEAYIPIAKIAGNVTNQEIADYLNGLRKTYIDMKLNERLGEDDVINEVHETNKAEGNFKEGPAEGDMDDALDI